MPRLGISQLRAPNPRFDIARVPEAKFETRADARREDRIRARLLLKHVPKGSKSRRTARKLARRLLSHKRPRTIASSRYMRQWRRRLVGSLWPLVHQHDANRVSTVTVIKRGISVPADKLGNLQPHQLVRQLRRDLDRAGGKTATGYAFFFLHGEYEPTGNRVLPHFHGVVFGDMIGVVDNLGRRFKKYKSTKAADPVDNVMQRIRCSRGPLANLPSPLSYCAKSYWPQRRIGEVAYSDEDGLKIGRARRGVRMRGDIHAAWLLWMNRWRIEDFSLLYHLRCGPNGREPTCFFVNEI